MEDQAPLGRLHPPDADIDATHPWPCWGLGWPVEAIGPPRLASVPLRTPILPAATRTARGVAGKWAPGPWHLPALCCGAASSSTLTAPESCLVSCIFSIKRKHTGLAV